MDSDFNPLPLILIVTVAVVALLALVGFLWVLYKTTQGKSRHRKHRHGDRRRRKKGPPQHSLPDEALHKVSIIPRCFHDPAEAPPQETP